MSLCRQSGMTELMAFRIKLAYIGQMEIVLQLRQFLFKRGYIRQRQGGLVCLGWRLVLRIEKFGDG